jgi:hypothetical protein
MPPCSRSARKSWQRISKESNPFADIDPPPQAIKGLEKNMTGWAKGDADKVIGWIKKKIAEDPAKSKFLKWQAAGLGKYYGVPLEKLADILPDEIKDKVTQASTQPSNAYAPEIETATGDFEKFLSKQLSPEDKKHILDALTVAKNTNDPSYLDSLFTSTDLSNTQISALKDILAGATPDAVTPEGPIAKKGEEPKAPEVPKHSTKDAVGYTKATLNNVGVDFAKLKPEDQKALLDAVKGALNANDEFGVVYFMNQLKTDAAKNKKGLDLSTDVIDELTFQILSDKEQEGDLDTDPDAFKKYLDPAFAVQEFLDKHPQFRDQLTPEMREKLFNAAKVGLSYTGKDGYAKAKAYYQDNLVGQIPGFDDQIFHDWRHGLKDFHDNLKNSTASIEQKKQELIAKKKAEHELKAALEKLGKGDMAQQVNSLISAAGLQDIPSNDKLAVQIAITKALDAPTSQDMMDQLDLIRGELAYGQHGSFDADVAKMHSGQRIKSVDSGKFNMLKKLVASQYKMDQDKYEPTDEPSAKEHSKDRAKRVLRNWLTNSNYGIHHFPATHHGEKQAVWNTVQKALQETDPKKVNSILNDLHTTTSINDKQIAALKQAVQHERQNPEGNNGAPLPDANIKKHGVEQKVQQAISSGSVTYEKFKNSTEMKKLLTKYGTNQLTNKDNVEGLVIGSLARNTDTEYEKKLLAAALKKALTNNGMDEQHAKNLANFVARESHKKSPLYALAKAAWESKNAGNTSVTPTATKGGKEMLAQLTHTQDPHNFARNEWVPGEQVKVSTSLKWEGNSHADNANANKYAEEQDQWRNKHLKPEDNKKFNWAADSWQATGQWGQDPNRRKAMLDIFTKTIEGPPPMLTKVDNFVERGLDVKAGDFADFIAAFQVGKKVYISPQGFSSNTSTPRGMADSYKGVGVLLRVKPNKNGVLKAGRVAYRSAHHMHGGEQELVVGTSDLQVSKVTKHVVTSGGEVKTYYEIEMQYDEELKEGVQTVNGFRPELWKGVPRNTVKMLIKYGGPLPRPKK